jgi:hypothetical protein
MMPDQYVQRTRGQYPAAPPSFLAWRRGALHPDALQGKFEGPNQDRRVPNDGIFARPENAVKLFKTHKCQR